MPADTPLLIDPIRHILHNIIQLSVDSLLHLMLREAGRGFAQSSLHLSPSVLDILLGRHPSQPLANLFFDDTFDVLSSQLVCLSLSDNLLQRAHIKSIYRGSWSRDLRAHETGQLLAIALGILTSLMLDRCQLFLQPTHFAIFCVVVLLGLIFRSLEVSEAFVDLGARTVRVLDIYFSLFLEAHQAVVVGSACYW